MHNQKQTNYSSTLKPQIPRNTKIWLVIHWELENLELIQSCMRNCHFDLAKGCAATCKITKAKKNSFLQYLFFYMSLFLVQFGEGQSNNSHKEHQKPNLFVSNPDRSKKCLQYRLWFRFFTWERPYLSTKLISALLECRQLVLILNLPRCWLSLGNRRCIKLGAQCIPSILAMPWITM